MTVRVSQLRSSYKSIRLVTGFHSQTKPGNSARSNRAAKSRHLVFLSARKEEKASFRWSIATEGSCGQTEKVSTCPQDVLALVDGTYQTFTKRKKVATEHFEV